ncbi:MAG: hypothetical protein AABZ47_07725 [Planctomycetota bacterium]
MAHYPDLQSGRFAVLADFEDPLHGEIFELERVSASADMDFESKECFQATGSRCLRFVGASPGDALLVSNANSKQWYLKRDWRAYDLLLMNIRFAEPVHRRAAEEWEAELTISAGSPPQDSTTHTTFPLRDGWNLVRFDLGDLGERVPLDDIREIQLSLPAATQPIELLIDDMMLTSNRSDLFGDSSKQKGELYVRRAGERIHVGAGGKFELTFGNGQIVEWYNLVGDSARTRNLIADTTLGPNELRIEQPGLQFPDSQDGLSVSQRVLEMNALRVRVQCEWRRKDRETRSEERPLLHRWDYTLYSTGQIHVRIESPSNIETTNRQTLWAATLATESEESVRTWPGTESAGKIVPGSYFALASLGQPESFMLYVPDPAMAYQGWMISKEPGGKERSFAGVPATGSARRGTWTGQIFLGDGSLELNEAHSRVESLVSPSLPQLEVGGVLSTWQGRTTVNGFDAATGCHVLALDHGQLRFILDGRQRAWYSPAFLVEGVGSQSVWVYVNHKLFEKAVLDDHGNLLIQLPGVIRDRVRIEVLVRSPAQSDNSP